MAKIKKQSLVDQIYSRLRDDILNLRFPLGSRINVNEIQDELGVSSTPLREAPAGDYVPDPLGRWQA